ncbi:MAG: hypothetical protein ABI664_09970 [bacterium]
MGGDWERFAADNGALELLPPEPLGQLVKSFIADDSTAQLYSDIYAKVRRTGEPLTFPLRCDGPDVVRELSMTISPTDDGFDVRSALVSEVARAAIPVLVAPSADADALVLSCGWCKRIDVRGHWFEIEVAVQMLSLFRQARVPAITHGICDNCMKRMEALVSAQDQ